MSQDVVTQLAQLEAERARLVQILVHLEWSVGEFRDGGLVSTCPWCSQERARGHDDDCELGKFLSEERL